jgi:hypothetical protein
MEDIFMGASTTAATASTGKSNSEFWERLWRMSGINFVAFAIIAAVIFGNQGNHTRVVIAAVIAGMSILNLLWFAAAIRTAPHARRGKTP